ncbi:MAG: MoxR family ATPase [Deltaproteobacteria bacterium]|nr:MoxR family ATPase [Deltaproteobacteria bacterium]
MSNDDHGSMAGERADELVGKDTVEQAARAAEQIKAEVGKKIVGQDKVIEHLLIALLAKGHCLFVGVPGLAKTMLVETLAKVLDLTFQRIQFTPDLMPGDITGAEVLEEDKDTGRRRFRFLKGPVFCHLLLADEVNRTPPKTQAALLQSMQEYRVTAGGRTYDLPMPFHVFATQNPIEQEGTYPLPEAQLDRFMLMIGVDYPDMEEEIEIVKRTTAAREPELKSVLGPERIMELQSLVREIPAAENVVRYAVELVRASRPGEQSAPQAVKDYLTWGAGPRASQFLILAAKARALLKGRTAARREDIRSLLGPVLRHRLITNFQAEAKGISPMDVINRLVESVGG